MNDLKPGIYRVKIRGKEKVVMTTIIKI